MAKRILVVGSGGREHALAWKLAQEAEVFVAPGNPGCADVAECFSVATGDGAGLEGLCKRLGVQLVLVGPEDPLIAGLADHLRRAGIAVSGPGADGAQLEGSKAFSKSMMRDAGVPTADFATFDEAEAASDFARSRFDAGRQVAVKASGAALGKGVVVCSTADEADDAIAMMLVDRELGEAGSTVVIEDRLVGREFSLLTLCSGDSFTSLPAAQDYKRALDGDRGPNTGGMGSYSPVTWLPEEMIAETESRVVAPMLKLLKTRGIDFRGVLFSGLMVQDGVPYCLEYNVRFGDPETQTVVRRIGSGLLAALEACAHGEKPEPPKQRTDAAVTVVVASGGYPGKVQKGVPIHIGSMPEGVAVFHAGTARDPDGHLVTHGGRVLGVSAVAATGDEARRLAYQGLEAIHFEGMQARRDIGSVIP